MSGQRVMCRYGQLTRTANDLKEVGKVPTAYRADGKEYEFDPAKFDAAFPLVAGNIFGAGLSLEINIDRQIEPKYSVGQRVYDAVSQGMMEVNATVSGVFVPEHSDWLRHLFFTKSADGQSEPGLVSTTTAGVTTDTYSFRPDTGPTAPNLFDLFYVKKNSITTAGGNNEWGIILGCVINSVTFSYESAGSDASVQMTIEMMGLAPHIQLQANATPPEGWVEQNALNIISGGCVSVSEDGSTYDPIAQTDSASVTISNNIEKRGNCLKLTASAYSLGTLSVEMSTACYSNDPKKYLLKMYGVRDDTAVDTMITPRGLLRKIPFLQIKSEVEDQDNKPYGISIISTDAYIGSINASYSVDSAIMDEPTITVRGATVTVKYPAPSNRETAAPSTNSDTTVTESTNTTEDNTSTEGTDTTEP